MRYSFLRLCLLSLACLCFVGCSGGSGAGGAQGPVTSPDGLVTTATNEFVLQRNVLILGPDVTVVSVEESSVTLGGNVPELVPDTVIIKNEGDFVFERKVVSVQQNGPQTLVQTVPAGLTEIYSSANIQQTQLIGSEVLARLEPAVPGLTLSASTVQGRHETDGAVASPVIQIDFGKVPVLDDTGQVVGLLKGKAELIYGFEQSVLVRPDANVAGGGVAEFSLVPFSHCRADVEFEAVSDAEGGGTVDLCKPLTFNLAPMGAITPVVECQLFLRWNGSIETPCKFKIAGGNRESEKPEEHWGVETRLGQRYFTGYPDPRTGNISQAFVFSSQAQIQEFNASNMTGEVVTPPESDIDFDLRFLEIKTDITKTKFFQSLPGFPQPIAINDLSLRQDVLRVRLQTRYPDTGGQVPTLESTLQHVLQWTANHQWTSFAVDLSNRSAVDVTEQVGKDKSYFQGPPDNRVLQGKTFENPRLPISMSVKALDQQPTLLRIGRILELEAEGAFAQGAPFSPAVGLWESSDPTVVRVLKARGKKTRVEALKDGLVIITCRHPSGASTQGFIQVVPPTVDRVTVSLREPLRDQLAPPGAPPEVSQTEFLGPLRPGEVAPLRATATWSDGEIQDVTNSAAFSIEASEVASLDGKFLRGEFPGQVTVTATLNPSGPTLIPFPTSPRVKAKDGSARFTIEYPPGSHLQLLPRPITDREPVGHYIGIGATVAFRVLGTLLDGSVREVTSQSRFTSSDATVASIEGGGLATGLAAGRTNIEASFGGNRTWVDLFVQDPALQSLSIQSPASLNQGTTAGFRAVGVFMDGSSRDLTNRVRWISLRPEVLSFGANGQATARAAGTTRVCAILDNEIADAEVTVFGPVRLVVTGQPPASVAPNAPFTLTVEVWDLNGRVAGATNEITLAIVQSAAGFDGTLSGQLVRRAVNGVAVFDNLRLDTERFSRVLLATSPGLGSASTQAFDVRLNPGMALVGHLFVANDNSGTGGVNSLAVDSGGVPVLVSGSPFATSGRTHAVERVSNLIVCADLVEATGACQLSVFHYDSVTGTLTPAASSPTAPPFSTNFNPLHIASNGVNAVFVLAEFEANVYAIRLDPSTGNVLSTNSVPIPGGSQPNELAFRASTGGGPDLLFVIQGNGGGNNVHSFSYDNATGLLTPGPVTPIGVGVNPGGLAVVGSRLYITNQGPAPDTISAFDINLATGGLSFLGSVPSGGAASGALHHLVHPVVGNLLFCANGPPEDTISAFSINAAGQPVSLGAPVPVGNANPHQFADLNLTGGQFGLYVTASTRLAAFLVDPTTAALTAITGSPFAGFNSPFGITR